MRRTLVFAGLLLALFAPAAFAAEGGLYLTLHGGAFLPEETTNDTDAGTFNFEGKEGWMAGGALGYDLRDAYREIGTGRIEVEGSARRNDLDEVEFAQGKTPGSGSIKAESLMFNTIGEFRETSPWLPYVGLGAGAARITLDQLATAGTALADDDDFVFAYQAMAGVGLQVACRFYLDLGYRYFATLDPEFTDAQGVKFESEYATHNVTLGLRLDF